MDRYQSLLEEYFGKTNSDVRALRRMSEDEKVELTKPLVESVYRATAERALRLDYDAIERSKGDITKIEGYQNLVDCIGLLNAMQGEMRDKIEHLETINNAHRHLVGQAGNFEQGFRLQSAPAILLYNNTALALFASVSFMIASTVDYVKDPVGSYSAHFRSGAAARGGYPTVFLKSLEKFNKMAVSGDLAKFFELSYSKKALVGAAMSSLASVMIATGVALSIVPIMREIVYQYYHMRVAIADYLRLQASFLEMNRARLRARADLKGAVRKQEAIMRRFLSLADRIDVDQKTSSKKAEIDIRRENNTISVGSPRVVPAETEAHASPLL